MTGYQLARNLAKVLEQELGQSFVDEWNDTTANQILDNVHAASKCSERVAVPLACYILGQAEVSPSSVDTYIRMVADQAPVATEWEEGWTGAQFAENLARCLGKSELTDGDVHILLDGVSQASMRSERLAVPLVSYLCGRARKGPGEIGSYVSQALDMPAES